MILVLEIFMQRGVTWNNPLNLKVIVFFFVQCGFFAWLNVD